MLSMTKKVIIVLMSTYNGGRYLREQLDSIYRQTYKDIVICIRDDGSFDQTEKILDEYKNKYKNIFWYSGINIGTAKSLFELMMHVGEHDVYYAFADQDDVWLPEKMEKAVLKLDEEKPDTPVLYCSQTTIVDGSLCEIGKKRKSEIWLPNFGNSLLENICIGCSCVMNKRMFTLIVQHIPQYAVMHDWWFYMTAACFGKVIFDENSYILYRQHEDNVLGSPSTKLKRLLARFKNMKKHKNSIYRQVCEFNDLYEIPMNSQELVDEIIMYKKNLRSLYKVISNGKISRHNKYDDIIFKILFILKQI